MIINWVLKKNKFLKTIFDKIKKDFSNVNSTLKNQRENLTSLADITNTNKEKIAKLEGAVAVILNSHSQSFSPILTYSQKQKKPQTNIEDIAVKKFKRAKKPEVMNQIKQLLLAGKYVVDIKEDLVDRQKLIPQSTFYRYVAKIQSENENENENKVRIINQKEAKIIRK